MRNAPPISANRPTQRTYARVASPDVEANEGYSRLAVFFPLVLLIPLTVPVGSLNLLVYRIILLLLFLPSLKLWLKGRAGHKMVADYFIFLLAIWSAVSFIVVHGFGNTWQVIGFHTLELVGAYFFGRSFVRTPETLFRLSRVLVIAATLVLPFALYEALTGTNISLQLWGYVGNEFTDINHHEPRLGFDRVQGPFEHPIHFGVFFGSLVGLAYFVVGYGRHALVRFFTILTVIATAFFSLSSGPFAAMVIQVLLIFWERALHAFRQRWVVFAVIVAILYVGIDILSNRTPIEVMISYLALNAQTGYGRILIFEYGMQNVYANPLFGVGMNEWVRPSWMTVSIDMLWMRYAVVHGAPGGIFLLLSFFCVVVPVMRREITDRRLRWYRMGWLVTMFGMFIAGWMVHFWRVPFVFYCFLLGAGSWFLVYEMPQDEVDDAKEPRRSGPGFTRFTPSRTRSRT